MEWIRPIVSKAVSFTFDLAGKFWGWITDIYPKVRDSLIGFLGWLKDISGKVWSFMVKLVDFSIDPNYII
jgi:hypothetical protein